MRHMQGLEKKGLIKVGGGIQYGKSFLQYEVENAELLEAIQKSYAVQGKHNKVM